MNKTYQVVIVSNAGSQTFKYPSNYDLSDAIDKALKTTGLKGVTSVTATII